MRTFKSYGLRQYKNCFVYSCKLNGAKNRKCEMNEKLKTTRTPVICGWQFGVPIAEKRHFSYSCIFFFIQKNKLPNAFDRCLDSLWRTKNEVYDFCKRLWCNNKQN